MGPTPPGQALAPGLAVNLQKLRINYSARMGVEGLEHLMQLGNGWGKVEADPPRRMATKILGNKQLLWPGWPLLLLSLGLCFDRAWDLY